MDSRNQKMPPRSRVINLWNNIVRHGRAERELDEEVRGMFETLVEEKMQRAMSREAAHRAATIELGRVESIKEEVRQVRAGSLLNDCLQDVRYGLRLLGRNPLFTLTATLSLALGIGGNTTIFSVINALMLRDLRVAEPQSLVEFFRTTHVGTGGSFSYPAYTRLRDKNTVFSGVLTLSKNTVQANAESGAQPATGRYVSGNFFDVLGVAPLAGRVLTPADDRDGSTVAVISNGFWQREFGGTTNALGQHIVVDRVSFTIVGILPRAFDDPLIGRPADFFIPITSEPLLRPESRLTSASSNWVAIIGRLKPGMTLAAATANLEPVFARLQDELAADFADAEDRARIRSFRVSLGPARHGLSDARRDFSRPVLLLMGAVGLVLLIACGNVVNLLLGRGVARQREIALRLAIGASGGRLIRQLLTESMLPGLLGGALGFLFSVWAAPVFVSLMASGGPPLDLEVAPDARILTFTLAVALGSALLAGVLPAVRTVRADIMPSFGGDTRTAATRGSARWGQALIAAQVALSMLLLVGAILLLTTLRNLQGLHPGFDREHVLLMTVDPARAGYKDARQVQYFREVLERVRQAPGVVAAAFSAIPPISGGTGIDLPLTVSAQVPQPGPMVRVNRVSDGFFATLRTPLRAGRDFEHQDGLGEARVAIINDALARKYFPNSSPLGEHVRLRVYGELEIVGVVANAKYSSLREVDSPTIYVCAFTDRESRGLWLSVRTSGDPLAFAASVRQYAQEADVNVPISQPRTLSSQVDRSLVVERLVARLLTTFALLALVLAAVGLYGVLGYSVARRTNEIGVRLALGATRAAVMRSILGQSSVLVGIGSAIGIPASAMLSTLLANFVYEVTPSDPRVLTGALSCLFVVALAAAFVPAWRASRIDPLVALRHE
jgi:putative ABC transport system permease protein